MGSLTRGCHGETPGIEGGWVRRKRRGGGEIIAN